eukprot:5275457-Amphidinium_carterae.1
MKLKFHVSVGRSAGKTSAASSKIRHRHKHRCAFDFIDRLYALAFKHRPPKLELNAKIWMVR